MKKGWLCVFALVCLGTFCQAEDGFRRLSVKEYRDKMKAGWIGQIAGVCWGGPTEFRWVDQIIPEADMPKWEPAMINQAFAQDDLYVEMTFLRTLEQYGLDASIRQAGIDFANSEYNLWCANRAGRNNLRSGIAPPDSGHPKFNACPNDIDYQIEADYAGLISPGMPNRVIQLGEKFGRLMNYSDGIYGGVFMGGMYAEAFFTSDLNQILDAGLACIPQDSQYAEMVRDLRAWHKENPNDWVSAWKKCLEKYRQNPEYQKCSNGGIDVKINGACILLGLLYGNGDLDQTIVISTRAGFDSDCNPSSSGGALFTTVGFSKLPDRFSKDLDNVTKFSYTEYNFPLLLDVCEKLTRQSVLAAGGRIEKDASGEEYFVIPVQKAKPMPLELSWAPGPIANSVFTDEEMEKIRFPYYGVSNTQKGLDRFFPGWKISDCGPDMDPGFRTYRGRENVLMTHPLNAEKGCSLSRSVSIPKGKKTSLRLSVANHTIQEKQYDWKLMVRVNGSPQFEALIGSGEHTKEWNDFSIDLTPFAGNTILLELQNVPNDWAFEAGYWSQIDIVSE